MRRITTPGIVVLLALAGTVQLAAVPDAKFREEMKLSIDTGVNWMRWQLGTDGTWGPAARTARVAHAFANSHRKYIPDDGPFMRRPVAFLQQALDGGATPVPVSAVILTSLDLMGAEWRAAARSAGPAFAARVAAMPAAAVSLQELAAIADALAAVAPPEPALKSHLVALATSAPAPPGRPEFADALRFHVHARLGAADDAGAVEARDRIIAAYGWWDGAEGGAGRTAPLAYWRALAAALQDVGRPAVTNARGADRDWRTELARILMASQHFDGFWEEQNDRIAATAEAVAAMEILYNAK